MVERVPVSVVETPEFLSATRKLMNDDERALLVDYLAHNPTAGDLVRERAASARFAESLKDEANVAPRGWSIFTMTPTCRSLHSPPAPRTCGPIWASRTGTTSAS